MENRRHLNHVETLRAIAALSVSVYHFSVYFTWNETTTNNFVYGAQGVEIFYLISGFIIPYSLYHSSYKIRHYLKYMSKRLVRLMPPYIVAIILINMMGIFLCKVFWGCDHQFDWPQIFVNIFFLADAFPNIDWINPIFATLEVELHFYIVIGLLFPLFALKRWVFPLACFTLLTLGILTFKYDTLFYNSPYFICGMSLFFIKEKGWKIEYITAALLAAVSLFIFYFPEDLVAAIIGFSALLFLPDNFKFLRFTGKISYSYYLIHGLAGGTILFFNAPKEFGVNNPILMMILAMAISWAAAFILYWFIERPSIRISKKIKYKMKYSDKFVKSNYG
ncbi:MAG: acyltransferase [Crocinitomicaceae bacterium]|nr:acyltransferase [Crocinitomicaceae bacterium]